MIRKVGRYRFRTVFRAAAVFALISMIASIAQGQPVVAAKAPSQINFDDLIDQTARRKSALAQGMRRLPVAATPPRRSPPRKITHFNFEGGEARLQTRRPPPRPTRAAASIPRAESSTMSVQLVPAHSKKTEPPVYGPPANRRR